MNPLIPEGPEEEKIFGEGECMQKNILLTIAQFKSSFMIMEFRAVQTYFFGFLPISSLINRGRLGSPTFN